MSRGPHPLASAPPFLVGMAAAIAAEGSAGLLLYSGAGFVRALTLILATVLAALALGLWSAPSVIPDPIEALRRRWHLALAAFVAGGLVAELWERSEGLGGSVGRGIGLAIFAALPLYAAGHLLGSISSVRCARGLRGPATPAALGGAAGAVVTGILLPRASTPVLLYGLGLVLTWLGALLHGRVLDRTLGIDALRVVDVASLAPDPGDHPTPLTTEGGAVP